ncbi:dATP pyrophosphohydrolase [Photobacterium lutimaris]|nr:dATP pyrophosphohydrolase [Photobacterium lutimaris]
MKLNTSLVSGVVLTKQEQQFKMLLLKRTNEGYWCNVAGKIEQGEQAWQAFLRELKEETRLPVTQLYHADYLQQFYYPQADQIFIATGFVAFCDSEANVALNQEHTDHCWCSLEEAIRLVPYPNQRKFYQHVWQYFILETPSSLLRIPTDSLQV